MKLKHVILLKFSYATSTIKVYSYTADGKNIISGIIKLTNLSQCKA